MIAHNVSVMVVQAAAAGDVRLSAREGARGPRLDRAHRPRGAHRAAQAARGSADRGRQRPQPGLGRLPDLLNQVRAAGLEVDLTTEGERRELPIGIDLSAYRIVQEALTNTLKHAAARRAEVVLRYSDEELAIDVLDDGCGQTTPTATRARA